MVLSLSLQLWFRLPTVFQGVIFQDVTISDGCCVTSIEPKKKRSHCMSHEQILYWHGLGVLLGYMQCQRFCNLHGVSRVIWVATLYILMSAVTCFFNCESPQKYLKQFPPLMLSDFFFVPSRNKKKESLTRCDSITRVSDHWFVFPLHMLDHSQWSWVECWHENCAKLST